nr:nicotinate-nucleotide adenylyltransferase [Lysobacter sp. CAU 1642]
MFGGTFDPVHPAHLAMAREALALCRADSLILLPAGDPPHREAPGASAEHRLRMLALACAGDPRLRIDPRELRRPGPSYSLLTAREYRDECGEDTPVLLVLGADAAAGLGSWHGARELPGLVHLLVLARPGARFDPLLPERLGWQSAQDVASLLGCAAGRFLQHTGPLMEHSATAVRGALREGGTDEVGLLDPAVLAYIREHGLYRSGSD